MDKSDGCCRYGMLIGKSRVMEEIFQLIECIAKLMYPAPITTESDAAKELVARVMYGAGLLAKKSFVAVDCSGLTPSVLDSELSGVVHGAFSGVESTRTEIMDTANSATLFVGNVRELQSVIARAVALEEGATLDFAKLPDAPPLETLASVEQRAILAALQMTGNKRMTAKKLGIGRTTLYRRLNRYRAAE